MIPLNAMTAPVTAVWATITLSEKAPDPADVKQGWLGFAVFILLAAAVVLLWFSFRKQLRKVDFEEPEPEPGETDTSGADRTDESDGTNETATNGSDDESR